MGKARHKLGTERGNQGRGLGQNAVSKTRVPSSDVCLQLASLPKGGVWVVLLLFF